MGGGSLDVVVPIFDEVGSVGELLDRLRRACPEATLIFVDNASTDGTREALEAAADVRLVRHERNLGYGTSLRDGVLAGRGERVVMIDADLEYLPEDVPAVAAALEAAPAVYGSRLRGPDAARMGRLRRAGNRLATGLFNALFDQRISDVYTGLRGFRREVLDLEACRRPGFEFVLELAAATARRGHRIGEVPVGYRPRTQGVSEMKHAREFAKFVWFAFHDRLAR